MKRGYKRLLIFDIIMIVLLFINSFFLGILSRYTTVIFLVFSLIAFKFLFGFEKDRHRYLKDVILEIVIFLFTFFILFYLLGLIIGFARTNYLSFYGIINFVLPVFLYVVLREIFRYMMLCKAEGNKLVTIVSIILFIILDITTALAHVDFASNVDVFKFIALSLLPAISSNIVLSYITKLVGYKPVIVYVLIVELYRYILPIIPNPNEYVTSVISFVLPVILGYRIYMFFKKDRDEDLARDYNKKHLISLFVPALIVTVLVYFTSGYFHYHAVAIASGSMSPNIHKGDVVIIEKIDKKFDKLKEGNILAFKKDKRIIVHRLVNIVKDNNKYYFYTKGDANKNEDDFIIKEDMVIGIVNHKIPFIGWPAVKLSGQ